MISAVLIVFLAVSISLLRYSLPYLEGQKHNIAEWISSQYGTEVKIGHIDAGWRGVGPVLEINNIQLINGDQSPIHLTIDKTQIDVDFWASITARQLVSKRFNLIGLNMTIDANQTSSDDSDFPIVNALRNLFLEQLQRFSVVDSSLTIINQQDSQEITIQRLGWINQGIRHQGVGQMKVADLTSNSASFVLDLFGYSRDLSGTFYADGQELDLSPWIKQVVPGDTPFNQNRVNFKLWADIQHSNIVDVFSQIGDSQFGWDDQQQTFVNLHRGYVTARPHSKGWLINLNELDFSTNEYNDVELNAKAYLDENSHLTFNISDTAIAPLIPIVSVMTDRDTADSLQQLAPQGVIKQASIFVDEQGVKADVKLQQVATRQWGNIPGLENVEIVFDWQYQQGWLTINAQEGQLDSLQLLGHALPYQQLAAQLYIDNSPQGAEFYAPQVQFTGPALNLDLSLYYRSEDNWLAIRSHVSPLPISDVKKLFPESLMGKNTYSYLNQALVSGTMTGADIIWNGPTGDYPFQQAEGVFQANVNIDKAEFDFDSDWPNLQQLQLNLLFENEGLWMASQQGRLMDVSMQSLAANIPVLESDGLLSIDIATQATAETVSAMMLKGGLAESVGEALQEIQLSGPLDTHVHLHIPFNDEPVVASGTVDLVNTPVYFNSLDFAFDQLNGQIGFENDHIQTKGLRASLAGQDIQLDLNGQDQETGFVTDVNLSGRWDSGKVLEQYYPGLAKYVEGVTDWQAVLGLTIPEQGFEYDFTLTSQLADIESALPAPFGKTGQQKLRLSLQVNGDQLASRVQAKLGEQVHFDGILPHQEKRFSRAHLSIGQEPALTMGAGFSISADLPTIDFDHWYTTLQNLINHSPVFDGEPVLGRPERIFVNTGELIALGQQFHKVAATVKLQDENWLVEVLAHELKMDISANHDWLGKGIDINADYINLPQWHTDEQDNIGQLNVSQFPPLRFLCQRCRYQQYDLGKVDLKLSRVSNGVQIDHLNLYKDDSRLQASGKWYNQQGVENTALLGTFDSDDFGDLLKDYELNSGIRDSDANIKFDLSWQGAPQQFNYASLNGKVNWRLGDGYLTEVSDKGARIFSILSLDSLVRKLRLDFRDVFTKGFFYDKMTGSFQVNNGRVNTDDTNIDGAAGEMQLKGYTDLPTKQLNYRIAFTPKVTSSLPVIVAWMVNPATAIAALALDEMISSAKVVSSIDFSLTGTLDDPQLKELGRDSREIMIPAQNTLPDKSEDPELILPKPVPESIPESVPGYEGVG